MKPRIPLAYAGLLIVALVAVVGFAAFSPSSPEEPAAETLDESMAIDTLSASARVASAILALRVTDADTRTATTAASDVAALEAAPETVTTTTEADTTTSLPPTSSSSTTSEEPTTTEAPTTTNAPTTISDTTPPSLRVTSPEDGAILDERAVTFRGTTEPGATVTSGPFEANVDDDGSWSLLLVLAPGPNGAIFTATDDAGNATSVRMEVSYEAPVSTTTTTAAPSQSTTTTTAAPSTPKWSPLWPADAGGRRDVEAWRSLVAKYWPAELVDCALNIIDLESHGDPRAYNSATSAEGLFQHLSKYWKGRAAAAGFKDGDGLYATPYNAEANIAAAWVIAKNSDPWHRPWTVNPYYGACQE